MRATAFFLAIMIPAIAVSQSPVYETYSFGIHEHAAPAWTAWKVGSTLNGGECLMVCMDENGVIDTESPLIECDEAEPVDKWYPDIPNPRVPEEAPETCTDPDYGYCGVYPGQTSQWVCSGEAKGHISTQLQNAVDHNLDSVVIVVHEYPHPNELGVGRPAAAVNYVMNGLEGFDWPDGYTPTDPSSETENLLSWADEFTVNGSFLGLRGQEITDSGDPLGLGHLILVCPNTVQEMCDTRTDCYYASQELTGEDRKLAHWQSLIDWAWPRNCLVVVAHPCVSNSGTDSDYTFLDTIPHSEDVVIGMELNSSSGATEIMCTGAGQSDGPGPGYLDALPLANSFRGALAASDAHYGPHVGIRGRTIVKIDQNLGLTQAGLWDALINRRFFAMPSLSYQESTNVPEGEPRHYYDAEEPTFDISICGAEMGETVQVNGECPIDVVALATPTMGYIGADGYPWSAFGTWELWHGDKETGALILVKDGDCVSESDCSFLTTKPEEFYEGSWVVIIREPQTYGGRPSMVSSPVNLVRANFGLILQDDWNDGDLTPNVPLPDSGAGDWDISNGFNNLGLESDSGPAGDGDTVMRWEPRTRNKTNRTLSFSSFATANPQSESWKIQWDEQWLPTDKNRDKIVNSSPVLTVEVVVNGSSTPVSGSWTLTRTTDQEDSSSDIECTLQIQGTFARTTVVSSGDIPCPDEFTPTSKTHYYRYKLRRVLDRIILQAIELSADTGEPEGDWIALADVEAILDGSDAGKQTIVGEMQEIVGFEVGALTTADGFDARMDNVEISLLDSLSRPATYKDFVSISQYGDSLESAIAAGETHIFLPQGQYLIDNPIIIDTDRGLHIHGAGNTQTSVQGWNADLPLFIVKDAQKLTVSGVRLSPLNNVYGSQHPSFLFENSEPIQFEMQDSTSHGPVANIEGPGRFVMQAVYAIGGYETYPYESWSPYAVKINHPDSEVYITGGNYVAFHAPVDQYQGHFEIYGSFMAVHPPIDSYPDAALMVLREPSPIGTHMIAGTRVEGTHRTDESRFLYVPTSSVVDVVIKGNEITYPLITHVWEACESDSTPPGAVVTYYGSGTVWLLGNYTYGAVNQLAKDDGVGAVPTIVAIGNFVGGCFNPLDPANMIGISGATKYHAENQFDSNIWFVTHEGPTYTPSRRFVYPLARLSDYPNVPSVPKNANSGNIPRLGLPIMDGDTPDGFLVSIMDPEKYCGLLTPPVTDYTSCIQDALDAEGANLYFPAGTYPITTTLDYSQTNEVGSGGMFAGAGKGSTIITMDSSTTGPVFRTRGMKFAQINGIGFEVQESHVTEGSPVMSLQTIPLEPGECEWPTRVADGNCVPLPDPVPHEKQFVTTMQNTIYNSKFSGGKYGVAIGTEDGSTQQGDTHLVVDSTIENAVVGFVAGSDNSMDNVVHGVTFVDNLYNLGTGDPDACQDPPENTICEEDGGSFGVFSATARGTNTVSIIRGKNANRAMYINKFTASGNKLYEYGYNTNKLSLLFDHAYIVDSNGSVDDPYLYFQGAMGFTFLHSTVYAGVMQYADSVAKALLSLHSAIANWTSAELGSGCLSEDACYAIQDELP